MVANGDAIDRMFAASPATLVVDLLAMMNGAKNLGNPGDLGNLGVKKFWEKNLRENDHKITSDYYDYNSRLTEST